MPDVHRAATVLRVMRWTSVARQAVAAGWLQHGYLVQNRAHPLARGLRLGLHGGGQPLLKLNYRFEI